MIKESRKKLMQKNRQERDSRLYVISVMLQQFNGKEHDIRQKDKNDFDLDIQEKLIKNDTISLKEI